MASETEVKQRLVDLPHESFTCPHSVRNSRAWRRCGPGNRSVTSNISGNLRARSARFGGQIRIERWLRESDFAGREEPGSVRHGSGCHRR